MNLINRPLALSRRPETLGTHPDLRPGETLIQMADNSEVMGALNLMAIGLRDHFGAEPPVCVPIMRGAAGTMDLLNKVDPKLFANIRPMTISTTDGQRRLPQPRILQYPNPTELMGERVLIVDGVIDTGHTLIVAGDGLTRNAKDHDVPPPRKIESCAAVLKLDAAKHDLGELLIAVAMTADKDDWVVGIGDPEHDGFDLSDRFRDLPAVWHIQTPSP